MTPDVADDFVYLLDRLLGGKWLTRDEKEFLAVRFGWADLAEQIRHFQLSQRAARVALMSRLCHLGDPA